MDGIHRKVGNNSLSFVGVNVDFGCNWRQNIVYDPFLLLYFCTFSHLHRNSDVFRVNRPLN